MSAGLFYIFRISDIPIFIEAVSGFFVLLMWLLWVREIKMLAAARGDYLFGGDGTNLLAALCDPLRSVGDEQRQWAEIPAAEIQDATLLTSRLTFTVKEQNRTVIRKLDLPSLVLDLSTPVPPALNEAMRTIRSASGMQKDTLAKTGESRLEVMVSHGQKRAMKKLMAQLMGKAPREDLALINLTDEAVKNEDLRAGLARLIAQGHGFHATRVLSKLGLKKEDVLF
jgi:hypothetical protein